MRTVTLYRLSGLAVMIGMTISGIASVLYSRAGGLALYLGPLVALDDLAKLFGSLIFLIGLPGLYAFQAARAGKPGLVGFVLSFFGLGILEVSTEALFAFAGPVLAAHHQTRFLLLGGLDQNLGGGFTAYLDLSYVVIVSGFVTFGIATFRAGIYPRWAGPVIAIGAVAAIVMSPLVSVPSGPFRLDRIGSACYVIRICVVWVVSAAPSDRSQSAQAQRPGACRDHRWPRTRSVTALRRRLNPPPEVRNGVDRRDMHPSRVYPSPSGRIARLRTFATSARTVGLREVGCQLASV